MQVRDVILWAVSIYTLAEPARVRDTVPFDAPLPRFIAIGNNPDEGLHQTSQILPIKRHLPRSPILKKDTPFVLPTPIKHSVLVTWLAQYPNVSDAKILSNGFAKGFSLNYSGPRAPRDSGCLRSASQHPQAVKDKLAKEIQLGRIAGPFRKRPFANLQCSPIGLVPKREPNTFRLIHHLSFPYGSSINDYINKDMCTVHYESFDKAVELVMKAGTPVWLAKADIKSAFRLLPVSPLDYELLGFTFDGMFYFDKCMPMGCSISCSLFEKFSSFLEYKVKQLASTPLVTHYLDDFLFISNSASSCSRLMLTFTSMCSTLGVPLAPEKTVGPVQTIQYLGLEINAVRKQIRVPPSKVSTTCQQIRDLLSKRKATLATVQSLLGSLNFLCKAIAPGRAFLRRLIALTCGLKKPHHTVRISKGARLDLLLWLQLLVHFNGVSAFLGQQWESNEVVDLFTDAAAGVGFGAYFKGKWLQGRWSSDIIQNPPSIAFLELFPILVALLCWAPLLSNSKILFHTDNMAVVYIINKQSSPCPRIMHLLRLMVLECLKYNVCFRAVHVPGVFNDIADSLSRFQMSRFHSLAPLADQIATPLPPLPTV